MTKILVVDDNPDFCLTIVKSLTDLGFRAQGVANESEAYIAVANGDFDFAVIDIRLHDNGEEDESGLVLAMALLSLNTRLHVIIITAYPHISQIRRALRLTGVVDFIEKSTPNVVEPLVEAISRTAGEYPSESSRLSFSLLENYPVQARARGHHVSGGQSANPLKLKGGHYALLSESVRQGQSIFRPLLETLGSDLWRDIFQDTGAKDFYDRALEKSYRLFLSFEGARDWLRIPLELTRSPVAEEYLILQHPVTRFVWGARSRNPALSPQVLRVKKELRVLVVASNTRPSIPGVDIEARKVADWLKTQRHYPVRVTHVPTEEASRARFISELEQDDYDVIHYAGHGWHNASSTEESQLFFWEDENKAGDVVPVTANQLNLKLKESKVHLFYLSCCQGTASGDAADLVNDDFLGLADAIVWAGVPSVLGFRWPVSDMGALAFAKAFYKSLLEKGSPEIAAWQARCTLAANRNDPTWLSPVLIYQE